MTTNERELIWLAGLLEGEACFSMTNTKSIGVTLAMTDKDVVERAAAAWPGSTRIMLAPAREAWHKEQWRVHWYGPAAVGLFNTILPDMGERRAAKIRELLAFRNELLRTNCQWCQTEFQAASRREKLCSDECKRSNRNAFKRNRRADG